MATTTAMVKELREMTGAGILDCKKALDATDGDIDKAVTLLREKGAASAAKKVGREASDGLIEVYRHSGNTHGTCTLGVIVEVNCETDFVARTEDFGTLAHNIALQVAASNPQWLSREDVPEDIVEAEKSVYRAEVADQGKPEHIVERIIEGKLNKFYQTNCLLEQESIRDDSVTIQQMITNAIAKFGENIKIKRFARFQLGE